MKYWKKWNQAEIKQQVFDALSKNVDFASQNILGVPASHLDEKVFRQEEPFLKEAPFLTALVQNPNHIGCHTAAESEPFFKGTHQIEKELIQICGADIFKAEKPIDGYVAAGGTEANIQAVWVYRNYFMQEYGASLEEITILCSEDSHYSVNKASNLLQVSLTQVEVDKNTRKIKPEHLAKKIQQTEEKGVKYYIVFANIMTTMFGSVDDPNVYIKALDRLKVFYKIHVDAAYGGFYYPFAQDNSELHFGNPKINSITLDAHKMAQAPYGTGIFLIRKNWMHYTETSSASYVKGNDFTLSGSRSGANAIAVWMILVKNGPYTWFEKVTILKNRTDWLCQQLDEKSIEYFREKNSNIVTIKEKYIKHQTAKDFGLVPDIHDNPSWFKIVVMDHVTIDKLVLFLEQI